MTGKNNLYIVYCVDTEGPLYESLDATFERIYDIFGMSIKPSRKTLLDLQQQKLDVEYKQEIAKVVAPHLLNYNDTWTKIDSILDKIMSRSFRNEYIDSKGNGIIYNWHCINHFGYKSNERHRDIGIGNVFSHYRQKIHEFGNNDSIHWHFHPLSFNRDGHVAATSYDNSMAALHQIICKMVIDYNWFPIVNRAGFHSIRQDSNLFLEQWIPFDYSNQSTYHYDGDEQKDVTNGRFGDWRRAPKEWRPYHPSFHDYQSIGSMRRYTTKCLNIGTRLRILSDYEIREAFDLARNEGKAILSFTNHDFRDMSVDILDVYSRIFSIADDYEDVDMLHCDAKDAMQQYCFKADEVSKNRLMLECTIHNEGALPKLIVKCINGSVFGSQPYLAIKTLDGRYYHDNFDELEYNTSWSYSFDNQTLGIHMVKKITVAANDKYGNSSIESVVL